MHLVIDHMLQSLVERWAKEDHYLHFLPCEAIVHDLISSQLVAQGVELVGDGLDGVLLLSVLEWRGIPFAAIQCRHFGGQRFNQVADCHS